MFVLNDPLFKLLSRTGCFKARSHITCINIHAEYENESEKEVTNKQCESSVCPDVGHRQRFLREISDGIEPEQATRLLIDDTSTEKLSSCSLTNSTEHVSDHLLTEDTRRQEDTGQALKSLLKVQCRCRYQSGPLYHCVCMYDRINNE